MNKIFVHPLSLGRNAPRSPEIFSAFYSLGCLTAYAKSHDGGALRSEFELGRITPTQEHELSRLLRELPAQPGILLFSSYVWNHSVNMAFARAAKQRWPTALVVVGGPHIPRHPDNSRAFFASHPYVDVAVRQEGERTLAELLATVAGAGGGPAGLTRVDLSAVEGLTFRRDGELVRTPDRARATDLSGFPSPYLTGEFDHWMEGTALIPVETNRGCPYGCTFCDWGAATLSKITTMSLERVFAEIELAARRKVHTVGLCDANFGILPRDLDIARHLADTRARHGWPREVGYTNAKMAKPRLLEIIKTLRDADLIATAQIALETTDEGVLENVERANIKISEYKKMIAFFHREQIPTVSDMMLGLPGQTIETCRKDLQFFFDHKVMACLFATSVMPNAPMADPAYRARFRIVTDRNGMVESTSSFTREEYARMFELGLAYKLLVKLGVLRYLLYYLQLEHGVKAMDFVVGWLARADRLPERYPLSHRVRTQILARDYKGGSRDWLILHWDDHQAAFLFDELEAFQREVLDMIRDEHGVVVAGSAVDAVLAANRAVMPRKGQTTPAEVALEHDVVGYFEDLRRVVNLDEAGGHTPLAQRPPGKLRVHEAPACRSYAFGDWTLTTGGLELKSDLRI